MTTKHTLIASLAVLACSAALAQAPAGVGKTPAEVSPSAAGGAAATSAQNKVDNKKANSSVAVANPAAGMGKTAPAPEIDATAAGGKAAANAEKKTNARLMDANGDGMVSRAEWDRYHADAWASMQSSAKNGLVSTAEIDAANRRAMVQ